MNTTQALLAYIAKHGSARSDQLSEVHGIKASVVSASLAAYVHDGTLVTCKVERPGQQAVNEYRLSVASGGRTADFKGIGAPPKHHNPKPLPRENARTADAPHGCTEIVKHFARDESAPAAPPVEPANGARRIGAIEKGVPLPPHAGELRLALSDMALWDSRLISGYTLKNVYAAAARAEISVAARAVAEGIRVWRTK